MLDCKRLLVNMGDAFDDAVLFTFILLSFVHFLLGLYVEQAWVQLRIQGRGFVRYLGRKLFFVKLKRVREFRPCTGC